MVRVGNNVEPMIGRIGALNQMINDPEVLSKCSCLVVIADDFVLVKARREKGGNVETPLRLARSVASQALRGLATNDQVNPDAANSVECDERRSPAARVKRLVRRFLRFVINCVCVNESVISSDLDEVNAILAKEPQFVTATVARKTYLNGSFSETFIYHLSKKIFCLSYLTNRIRKCFSKRSM